MLEAKTKNFYIKRINNNKHIIGKYTTGNKYIIGNKYHTKSKSSARAKSISSFMHQNQKNIAPQRSGRKLRKSSYKN